MQDNKRLFSGIEPPSPSAPLTRSYLRVRLDSSVALYEMDNTSNTVTGGIFTPQGQYKAPVTIPPTLDDLSSEVSCISLLSLTPLEPGFDVYVHGSRTSFQGENQNYVARELTTHFRSAGVNVRPLFRTETTKYGVISQRIFVIPTSYIAPVDVWRYLQEVV